LLVIKSIIVVITALSIIVRHTGITLTAIAPLGIVSLSAIGPSPVSKIPVPLPVPSPDKLTTSAQIYELVLERGGVVCGIKSLPLVLSKHCCTPSIIGALNLINEPTLTYFNDVFVYVDTKNGFLSDVEPKYPDA